MKVKPETIFAVVAVVALALYMGWMTIPGLNISGNLGGGGAATPGLESVNKPIKFTVMDKYAGSAIDSDAGGLLIYNSALATVETLNTDANGQVTTSNSYPSGTTLKALFTHDSSRQWFQIIVPKMSGADADSLVTTPISLETYNYTAPTMSVRTAGNSTVIADGGEYNQTVTGATASPVFTVSWFQPRDSAGYISSFDPIYGIQNKAVLVCKLSNTNYELISISGFDGQVERGAASYYYKVIDDSSLTKWKVGDTYLYQGTGSYSFAVGLSGYTGDLADMDFYIYENADPAWFITHGNWGPNSLNVISGAPYTINMEEGD